MTNLRFLMLLVFFALLTDVPTRTEQPVGPGGSTIARVQLPSLLQRAEPFEGEWRITATEHFDITFVAIAASDLDGIAAVAERAYLRTSGRLAHQLSLRPLVVVFPTRADLDQAIATRTFPGNREHLLWALDTPAARVDGDFSHELTHVFAFDIIPPSLRGDIPGWLHEGLADFERESWDEGDLRMVRALLREGSLPAPGRMPIDGSAGSTRIQRVVGHLALDFLAAQRGLEAVRRVLASLREDVTSSPIDAYLAEIGLPPTDFDREFERWIRTRFDQ